MKGRLVRGRISASGFGRGLLIDLCLAHEVNQPRLKFSIAGVTHLERQAHLLAHLLRFGQQCTCPGLILVQADAGSRPELLVHNSQGAELLHTGTAMPLGGLPITRYAEAKGREAALDFEDLQLEVRDLLRSDEEIRLAESQRFRAVMIDEFQDTNRLQTEILDLLTGGTEVDLFSVGDEFQSIYGFRHADVAVFRERRHAADVALSLTLNYRSRPEVLGAITSFLLTRAQIFDAQKATIWLTGSLNGRDWQHVRSVGLALVVLVPVAIGLARHLRILELGDDTAKGLGARVELVRGLLLVCAVSLAAVAVASAGPIAFVALVAPQIARRLVDARTIALVPAAVVGALLMVLSDVVGRRIVAPTELPVGIITAVVGAPFLLFLLARANRIGSGG